jgi:hypothetical protein
VIELSSEAARAAPGIGGLIIAAVGWLYYRREKKIVDRQRAERGDAFGRRA